MSATIEAPKLGSVRNLWKISYPMMISYFSLVVMMFIDRLFLSYYSKEALNAATSSGTLYWAMHFGWVTLVSVSQVFVAQYNGAKKHSEIGNVVWQMIWIGLASALFFIPMGYFGAKLLLHNQIMNIDELSYFRWNIYFAPFVVLLSSISIFFVGIGKTKVIKWLAILGNIINVALDPILIFGIKGYMLPMGVKGAAIATGFGVVFQVIIIGYLFLQKENQARFHTHRYRFDINKFKSSIKVGLPPAVFTTLELMGWAIFFFLMAKVSYEHILVSSVCQSILMLLFFFGMGLEKGVSSIAGNLLGSNNPAEIKNLFRSGLILISGFTAVSFLICMFCSKNLILWFFPGDQKSSLLVNGELFHTLELGFLIITIYLVFQNVRWLLSGILTAAGDTIFIMLFGTCGIWLFLIFPTYFVIFKMQKNVLYALSIWIFYSLMTSLLFLFRYLRGKWKKKNLIDSPEKTTQPVSNVALD